MSGQVTHPVNQVLEKLSAAGDIGDLASWLDLESVNRRVTRLIGVLVGRPLSRKEDVRAALTELSATVHARLGAGA
jgi:hypothetical protein